MAVLACEMVSEARGLGEAEGEDVVEPALLPALLLVLLLLLPLFLPCRGLTTTSCVWLVFLTGTLVTMGALIDLERARVRVCAFPFPFPFLLLPPTLSFSSDT